MPGLLKLACSTWELVDKRRLYCFRPRPMTKTESLFKKKNNVSSELSEDNASSDNRITIPQGFSVWGRIHYGGDSKIGWNIHNLSPPGTGHQSPGSQLHQSLGTRHKSLVTSHRSLSIGHQAPVTNHWAPVSEYRPSNTGHQAPVIRHRAPVTRQLTLSPVVRLRVPNISY